MLFAQACMNACMQVYIHSQEREREFPLLDAANIGAFRHHNYRPSSCFCDPSRKAGTVEILSEPREARDFDGKGHPDWGCCWGLHVPNATSC